MLNKKYMLKWNMIVKGLQDKMCEVEFFFKVIGLFCVDVDVVYRI